MLVVLLQNLQKIFTEDGRHLGCLLHIRSHGEPPREPWLYSKEFLEGFRKADNMRYELMPYIYAQAKESSQKGLPMLRALFVEFPNDPELGW
jgi:alpha-glucosidase (family GH31 glycosyl hydrolase)